MYLIGSNKCKDLGLFSLGRALLSLLESVPQVTCPSFFFSFSRYIFGGRSCENGASQCAASFLEQTPMHLGDFWAWKMHEQRWKNLSSDVSPSPRSDACMVRLETAHGPVVYLYGGLDSPGSEGLSDFWMYTPGTGDSVGRWICLSENAPPGPQWGLSCAAVGTPPTKIILLGNGHKPLDVVYTWEQDSQEWRSILLSAATNNSACGTNNIFGFSLVVVPAGEPQPFVDLIAFFGFNNVQNTLVNTVCSVRVGCGQGFYAVNNSFAKCQPCDESSYSSDPAAKACTHCPEGTKTASNGSISYSNCSICDLPCQYGSCQLSLGRKPTCICHTLFQGTLCENGENLIIVVVTILSTSAISVALFFFFRLRSRQRKYRATQDRLLDESSVRLKRFKDLYSIRYNELIIGDRVGAGAFCEVCGLSTCMLVRIIIIIIIIIVVVIACITM